MPDHDGSPLPFFSIEESSRLHRARRAVSPETATIAYCLYENPFARCGGLYAVADNYSQALHEHGRDVILLTPYHSALRTSPGTANVQEVDSFEVSFGGRAVSVSLFEHRRHAVRWYLLRSDGFFDAQGGPGGTDPYSYGDPGKLLTDSLFLSAAVPHALATLGHRKNVIAHLQDWELATAALTVKTAIVDGVLDSAGTVLTTHNPYDQDLPGEALALVTSRTSGRQHDRSVFQHMIPLIDGPLTTVSQGFARELVSDPLQTGHFAAHMQAVLKEREVVGIDNGLFGTSRRVFSKRAVSEAQDGRPAAILGEKLGMRKRLIEVLVELGDERARGRLTSDGGPLDQLPDDVPVLLMFGRLDPGQKGFDVLTRAIEALPRQAARFIITPVAGTNADPYVDDLLTLADRCPGEVVVLPFRLETGYAELLSGASYIIMPSLYEPFGGATEAYLAGTPVVARATGGLVQQVVDVDSHRDEGTGLLYHESEPGDHGAWREIETARSPAERMEIPTYRSMVDACTRTLARACDIYRNEPDTYGRMLARLFDKAAEFSWDRAIGEYEEIYRRATQ